MSWRYYHVDQWTADQLKILKKRGQPLITFDRTGRKIDSLGGTIRRLRTDPKVLSQHAERRAGRGSRDPSDPRHLRCFAMRKIWKSSAARTRLMHGFGVDELMLMTGRQEATPICALSTVDPKTFFYDPRSLRTNFGDARFHGIYKWADIDELEEFGEGDCRQGRRQHQQ